ncbi:MAG TPA: hypothetical protein VIJ50_01645 [Solirubrobacteraceae bacterium]
MKRLVLATTLTLALTLSAAAYARRARPIYFWGSVAAAIRAPGQQPAPEMVRPSLIFMFADGSWDIEHLRWSGRGSRMAHATGTSSASDGIPNEAEGKRVKKPAQVTLSDPVLFAGHEVYRCFTLTISPPAGSQHLCLGREGAYWYFTPS